VTDSYVKAMKNSPVVELDFSWDCKLPVETLGKILEAPQALQRLTCPMLGIYRPNGFGPINDMAHAISPCSISQSLSPTAHSLVDLTIADRLFLNFPGHNGTRLNLSDFTRLKTCSVPAYLFFGDGEAHPSRDGLYKLLPGSLEIFQASCSLQKRTESSTATRDNRQWTAIFCKILTFYTSFSSTPSSEFCQNTLKCRTTSKTPTPRN
jgi:hypothetical protein